LSPKRWADRLVTLGCGKAILEFEEGLTRER